MSGEDGRPMFYYCRHCGGWVESRGRTRNVQYFSDRSQMRWFADECPTCERFTDYSTRWAQAIQAPESAGRPRFGLGDAVKRNGQRGWMVVRHVWFQRRFNLRNPNWTGSDCWAYLVEQSGQVLWWHEREVDLEPCDVELTPTLEALQDEFDT